MVNEIIACHEIVCAWKKNKKIKKNTANEGKSKNNVPSISYFAEGRTTI